jgi:integrase
LAVYDSRFPGRKFFYSTGQSRPAKWKPVNGKKKDSGIGFPKECDENRELIEYLELRADAVKVWGKTQMKTKALEREELRKLLDNIGKEQQQAKEQQMQNESDFLKIWQKIIDTTKGSGGEKISDNTKKSKQQTLVRVTQYCLAKNLKLSFEALDMEFYHAFDEYLDSQGLSPNSKGKHMKEIKAIMREAHDRDIAVNPAYLKKSFKVIRKETDNAYLTIDELKRMLTLKLSPIKAGLRDIFVMASFCGLRHSDWHQIRPENIVTQNGVEFIKAKQTKTADSIHIPVHPIVRIILNKYQGNPPRVISNQKFNEALKEICKHEDLKLGKVIINGKSVEKADYVSTHTARRSFATNAYLSKSMSVYSIMSCTGHKTESSFLKYLKLSGLDKAVDIAESKFFKADEWANLKVA